MGADDRAAFEGTSTVAHRTILDITTRSTERAFIEKVTAGLSAFRTGERRRARTGEHCGDEEDGEENEGGHLEEGAGGTREA